MGNPEKYTVLRVVPKGQPAAGWTDDDDEHADWSGPCDLVALEAEDDGEDRCEREVGREAFGSQREASTALAEMCRQPKPEAKPDDAEALRELVARDDLRLLRLLDDRTIADLLASGMLEMDCFQGKVRLTEAGRATRARVLERVPLNAPFGEPATARDEDAVEHRIILVAQRPPAEVVEHEGGRRLRCPHCGSDGVDEDTCRLPRKDRIWSEPGWLYVEWIEVYRHVGEIGARVEGQDAETESPGPLGVLAVDGEYHTGEGWDDGADPHLYCKCCGQECEVPDGLAIDWIV